MEGVRWGINTCLELDGKGNVTPTKVFRCGDLEPPSASGFMHVPGTKANFFFKPRGFGAIHISVCVGVGELNSYRFKD